MLNFKLKDVLRPFLKILLSLFSLEMNTTPEQLCGKSFSSKKTRDKAPLDGRH
jgi:hypothetical protein